jgi:hypothetical protein
LGDTCRRAPYQRTRLRLRWRASRSGGLRPMTQWPARCAGNQGCQLSTNRCGPTSSGTRSPAPPALLRRRSRFPWRLECPAVTRACSNHIDPFDGAKSVHSARHATQRDACVSGKLRNDDDGLIWPTEGRFFTPAGRRYASLVVGSDHGVKPAWPADVKNRSNGSI